MRDRPEGRHQGQQQAAGRVGNDHHRLAVGAVLGQGGVQLLGNQAGVVGPGQLRPVDRQRNQQRPVAAVVQFLGQPRVGSRTGHAAVNHREQGHCPSFPSAANKTEAIRLA
jgi:hypothetical protein